MNHGKICISICAGTAGELNEQIERTGNSADMIEIRFDCLDKDQINSALEKINPKKSYIFTFRSKEQGGKKDLTLSERNDFWNVGDGSSGADFEEDVVENHLDRQYRPVICSYHDFNGVPENLGRIYERIKNINARIDVIKIAVKADDITDTIAIWQLLKRARVENREIIPIAMGEAGKWTRILGLAHGAFLTYASLEAGGETAPGQVSARELLDIYRVKELDEKTEVYGIVGGNTSYSMSPLMHNTAFRHHGLNSVFLPLEVRNLAEFMKRMVKPATHEIELNFRGFAVTNPHKQEIMRHLDVIDETAREIGAVNTVKIVDGRLYGFNTDAYGFIEPLLNAYGDLNKTKVAVLGAGGAARACVYALKKQGAAVTVFARNPAKAKSLARDFQIDLKELPGAENQGEKINFNDFDILVNSTPLGTKDSAENETPAIAEQFEHIKLAYDLVYNPFQTKFMQEATGAHVPVIGGMAMLAAQAAAQQKIWTNLEAPIKEMSAAVLQRLK